MRAPRTRRARAGATVLVALSVGAGLSGCGAGTPGAAAVVNGQVVPEQSLDDVAADFAKLPQAQSPQRRQIAGALVLGPVIEQSLGGFTGQSAASTVRGALSKQVPDPSDATVRVFQIQQRLEGLDQKSAATLRKAMSSASVQINPRYGAFDPRQGLVPLQPNWIAPGPQQAPASGRQGGTAPGAN